MKKILFLIVCVMAAVTAGAVVKPGVEVLRDGGFAPLQGKRVLDCGCGTGILGICALKLGAASCVGYDIDEWSTDNTRHNAVINHVDDRLESLCGDATVLSCFAAEFDVVLANINRNILLHDMEHFVRVMAPGATLILSGFYQSDCQMLADKARTLGLHPVTTDTDGDWACLVITKEPYPLV